MSYSSCRQKLVLLKVFGVIRQDTFLFLCQSCLLLLLLEYACIPELIWILESVQTLCYLLFSWGGMVGKRRILLLSLMGTCFHSSLTFGILTPSERAGLPLVCESNFALPSQTAELCPSCRATPRHFSCAVLHLPTLFPVFWFASTP